MAQLIQQSESSRFLRELLQVNNKALINSAPRTIGDPNRLLRVAYNTIAYDDKLSQCLTTVEGRISILGGVMEAVKMGITLGGPMQEGWLLPFSIRGVMKAQLIVGYMGYRNIMDRSRAVIDLTPRAVHILDADNFDYELGSNPFVRFRPKHQQPTREQDVLACFGVANIRGGGRQIDVLLKDEIDAHRARSRAKDNGPWVTDYPAMGMKTVVRKMAKYLPKSSELLARAMELDTQVDTGVEQAFDIEGLDPLENAKPAGPTSHSRLDTLKGELLSKQENADIDREASRE